MNNLIKLQNEVNNANEVIKNTHPLIWEMCRKIDGYSDYLFFNWGACYSMKQKRFIGYEMPTGYIGCAITSDDGEVLNTYLHRLVWVAFNGEIPEGLTINHNDENKQNNSVANLSLMTAKEQANYGTRNERISISRRITELHKKIDHYTLMDIQEGNTIWPSGIKVSDYCHERIKESFYELRKLTNKQIKIWNKTKSRCRI